jgi:hypothetical protein
MNVCPQCEGLISAEIQEQWDENRQQDKIEITLSPREADDEQIEEIRSALRG